MAVLTLKARRSGGGFADRERRGSDFDPRHDPRQGRSNGSRLGHPPRREPRPTIRIRFPALIPIGVARRIRNKLVGESLQEFLRHAVIDGAASQRLAISDAELMVPLSFSADLPVRLVDWIGRTFPTSERLETWVSRCIVTAACRAAEGGVL